MSTVLYFFFFSLSPAGPKSPAGVAPANTLAGKAPAATLSATAPRSTLSGS